MADVICGDIQKLFYTRADDAKSAAEQVKTIMNVSFHYAVTVKEISNSPADGTEISKTEKTVLKAELKPAGHAGNL